MHPRVPDQIPPESERDPDQWWFWTPEWQAGEREVDEQLTRGEYEVFQTTKELMAWLRS
jgi:hypothetical protein